MIFGIPLASWAIATSLITLIFWLYFFVVYTFNIRPKTDFGLYFRAMIKSFSNSELRIGWSTTLLSIEYVLGLIVGAFINCAWYPAQWLRSLTVFVMFSKKRIDRLERDKHKDAPKKKAKDNGGVY